MQEMLETQVWSLSWEDPLEEGRATHSSILALRISWTEKPGRLPPSSVQFSCSVMSNSLRSHGLQHTRLLCPSPTPRACSNSCPLSWWYHPTISFSIIPFSSCLQSFPASGSFPMSQLFASGGKNIGVSASASVLSMNIRDWLPLGWIGWILAVQCSSKALILRCSAFFIVQLSHPYMTTGKTIALTRWTFAG